MPQNELASTTIGEFDYEMAMIAARRSNRLLIAVAKMVGPAVGPLIDKAADQKKGVKSLLDVELGADFFSKALSNLFAHLDEDTLDRVVDEFAKVTFVTGVGKLSDQGKIDIHFQDRIGDLYKWLLWGMKVQWGKSLSALDFFTSTVQGAKKEKESQSPSTSTG